MEQMQISSESTKSLKSELKDREETIKSLQITLQQQDNFIIQLKQQIKNQSNQSKSSNNNDLNEEIRMLEIKLIESHKINDKYVENIQELNKKYDYERLKNNSLENELNTAIKKLGENLNVYIYYYYYNFIVEKI